MNYSDYLTEAAPQAKLLKRETELRKKMYLHVRNRIRKEFIRLGIWKYSKFSNNGSKEFLRGTANNVEIATVGTRCTMGFSGIQKVVSKLTNVRGFSLKTNQRSIILCRDEIPSSYFNEFVLFEERTDLLYDIAVKEAYDIVYENSTLETIKNTILRLGEKLREYINRVVLSFKTFYTSMKMNQVIKQLENDMRRNPIVGERLITIPQFYPKNFSSIREQYKYVRNIEFSYKKHHKVDQNTINMLHSVYSGTSFVTVPIKEAVVILRNVLNDYLKMSSDYSVVIDRIHKEASLMLYERKSQSDVEEIYQNIAMIDDAMQKSIKSITTKIILLINKIRFGDRHPINLPNGQIDVKQLIKQSKYIKTIIINGQDYLIYLVLGKVFSPAMIMTMVLPTKKKRYHFSRIYVTKDFLKLSEKQQVTAILHEIGHFEAQQNPNHMVDEQKELANYMKYKKRHDAVINSYQREYEQIYGKENINLRVFDNLRNEKATVYGYGEHMANRLPNKKLGKQAMYDTYTTLVDDMNDDIDDYTKLFNYGIRDSE